MPKSVSLSAIGNGLYEALLEKVDSAAKLGLQIDRYDPSSAYLVHDDRGPAYPLENFVEPFDIDLLKEEAIDFVFLNDASCSIDLDTLYRVYQKPLLLVGKPKENVRHFVIGIVSKRYNSIRSYRNEV